MLLCLKNKPFKLHQYTQDGHADVLLHFPNSVEWFSHQTFISLHDYRWYVNKSANETPNEQ